MPREQTKPEKNLRSNTGNLGTEEEDRHLIQKVQEGDHQAFDAIFQRYVSRVFHQVFRFLGNEAEAEEIVREVFLTIYQKAHTFRGESAFSTWLFRVTANTAINKLRRRKRSKEVSIEEYLPSFTEDGHHEVRPVVDWSQDLEGHLAKEELRGFLQQAIDELPPVDKAVIVLSDLEGNSNQEIAEILELSGPAVKGRLHRARLFLRGKLAVSLGPSPF